MKSKLIFTIAFIGVVLTEIIADLNQYYTLVYVFKPLILISLIIYTKITTDERYVSDRKFFVAGLWFALLGDIFLMIRGKDLFVPGLASFLIMQIMYTYSFGQDGVYTLIRSGKALTLFLPFLSFTVALFMILQPHLPGVLKIAVGVYAGCIAAMSWTSLLRKNTVSRQSFLLVFAGALLFMASDSLIAIDRVVNPVPFNTIWVMSTYSAAQYLILIGYLKTK